MKYRILRSSQPGPQWPGSNKSGTAENIYMHRQANNAPAEAMLITVSCLNEKFIVEEARHQDGRSMQLNQIFLTTSRGRRIKTFPLEQAKEIVAEVASQHRQNGWEIMDPNEIGFKP